MPTPDTVIVIIQKYKFQTGMVTVKAGDVVVWRNLDVAEHTLTADSGAFESPLIKPGERWSFRFTTAGTFAYHCMPHPFMKAEIHVRKVTP
jgi:amicyanin